jgi:hypothetical protein
MKCLLVIALIVALGACGASSAEVKAAQTARYQAPTETLYDVAKRTTEQDYKIVEEDQRMAIFMTEGQWYNPEGGRESAGAGDYVQLVDRSVMLSMIVEVVEIDDAHSYIKVTPKVFQHISGSPKPRELKPEDPNMPGWIQGRVEELQVAIYKNAKQYEALR